MIHFPLEADTSKRLASGYGQASDACEVALAQVSATAPIRSDYASTKAFKAAEREHDERRAHLFKIIYEMKLLRQRCLR